MWRYLAGVGAVTLATTAYFLFGINSRSQRPAVAPPPLAAAVRLSGESLAPPPAADERDREAKRFARFDSDRNGAVSRDEFLATRHKAYAKLDTNHDGNISFDEFSVRSLDRFAKADGDASASLNRAEFAATRPVRHARPRPDCPPTLRQEGEDG